MLLMKFEALLFHFNRKPLYFTVKIDRNSVAFKIPEQIY